MQPWWLTCGLEGICVVSGMLTLHGCEARQLKVGQMATKVGFQGVGVRHIFALIYLDRIDLRGNRGQIHEYESSRVDCRLVCASATFLVALQGWLFYVSRAGIGR